MLDTTSVQTKSAPPPVALSCAACGSDNTPDSRFCRHCGVALTSANGHSAATPKIASVTAATAQIAPSSNNVEPEASSTALPNVALDGAAGDGLSPRSSNRVADEIDHRRAQQLLDRAFMLAERGDKAAAIIACRQAVSLDHNSASGYSILGLLLEQTGDAQHAIQAYEHVLAISPDSLLERESLQRLKAALGQSNSSNIFHFNEEELYEDTPAAQPTDDTAPVPLIAAASADAAPVATAAVMTGAAVAGAALSAAASPAAPVSPASPSAPAATNLGVGTRAAVAASPVISRAPAPTSLLSQPLPIAPSPVRPVDFGMPFSVRPDPWWVAMQRQPSFYFRGFPLTAATAMCLLFLLWARNWAVSKEQPSQITTATTQTTNNAVVSPGVPPNNASATTTGTASTTANGTANNGGFSVTGGGLSGATAAPGQPGAAASGGQTTTGGTANTGSNSNRLPAGAGNAVPQFPGVTPRLAPAVPVPGANNNANKSNEDSFAGLPQPKMEMPDRGASTAVKVLPADRNETPDVGAASMGGAPLNPGGAGRGYVRVSPYRIAPSAVPPRSAAQAAAAEARANQAIQAGHADRAADILTPSMDSGDVAYNYQSRALLFMERGDYGRARDDFQTAINYYREQIQRGVNVNASRKGLQTCEDGRREALARSGG